MIVRTGFTQRPEGDARRTVTELSEIIGLDTSSISRRYDVAKMSVNANRKLAYARSLVEKQYEKNIAESQD